MALNTGTYEAQIIELYGDRGDVKNYTIGSTTAVSKGAVMILADNCTVAKNGNSNKIPIPVAGIAAHDKSATDGSTTIGVYTNGKFLMRVDEAIGVNPGDYVVVSGANNQIRRGVAADVISGAVLGKAIEVGADESEIAIMVRT